MWYNLAFTETTNNTANSTITFASGSTQTIEGALTFDGFDGNDMLVLVSSTPGTAATIAFTGTSTFAGTNNYVNIRDSIVTDSSSAVTLPLNPANSTNTSNTTGWFPTLTGTVYTDEGVTNI